MMKFKMLDEREFEGDTYEAIVAAMAGEKMTEVRSNRSYREATARRVVDLYSINLDTETDEKFVRSMVNTGLMEKVS